MAKFFWPIGDHNNRERSTALLSRFFSLTSTQQDMSMFFFIAIDPAVCLHFPPENGMLEAG